MGLCCSDMRSEDHHLDDVSHAKSFSPRNGNSINTLENEDEDHHQIHHHDSSSSFHPLPESISLHTKTSAASSSRGTNISSSQHGKHKKASLITTSLRTHVHSCSEGEAEDEDGMMEGQHSPSSSSTRNKKKKKKKSRSKKNNDSVSSSSSLVQQLKKSTSEKTALSGHHHVLDITSSFAQNSPRSNYYYYEDVMPTNHDDEDGNESSADETTSHHHPTTTAIHHHPHYHLSANIPHSNSTASYSSVVKYSSIIRNKIESASASLSSGYPQSASHHSNHHPPHPYPTPSPSLLTLSLQQQQIQQHMEAKRKQGKSRRTLSEYQTENAESKPITTTLSFTEKKAGPVTSKPKQSALDYKKQQQLPLVQLEEDSEEVEEGEDIEISDDESSSMDSEEKLDKIQQQQTGSIRKHPRKHPPQKSSVEGSSATNSWFTIPNNLPKVNRVKTKGSSKNQVDSNTTLLFKVILLGDSSVGKSACLSRIEGNAFSNLTRKTVGLEFTTRLIDNTALHQNAAASPNSHISMTSSPPGGIVYPTKHKIQLQFWDMGFDSYSEEALFNAYLKDVQAIICVYSINSVSSFERLKQLWNTQVLPQLLKNCYLPHVKIVLLGNKTDLDGERSVDYSQGLEFARAMNKSILNAIYSSSPTNNNAQQSLDKIAANSSEFMTELKTTKNEPFGNTSVSLDDNSLTANSSSSVDDCDRVDAVKFFECSAKTGQNIETATQTLAHDLDTYFSNYL
ncbi:hypothetical protein C9374_007423 [Naegleria lovaniensis]|uniref:Uncharacterized protein n=1 Tax=Naegleria lovaniensis TaxID=51637 RepID=A0AA88GH34_NAELO|nr:uncharacterized protein C9374_007423 [Naegleria lovaniensis]KAG2379284.1 hypothetical protein C9374_007423 [Naegleria lovaniensis]